MIDETENPEWMLYYRSALLELDSRALRDLIQKAEVAIRERLETIGFGANVERQAIRDASRNLRVLQEELVKTEAGAPALSHTHPEVKGKYVVFVDANRRYLDVTEGVCSLLGYTRSELLGKTIDDITAPEMKSMVPETFQKYVSAGGLSGQFMLLARDGRRVTIHYESKVFPDGCLVARWDPLPSAA